MIANGQVGNFALVLALAMTLTTAVAFLLTALGKKNLFNLGVKAFTFQVLFVTVAFAFLYYLFFAHNFNIKYVYEYSSSDLPFFYLLSALWGGQEGTYLLWLFLSTIMGIYILRKGSLYTTWGMFFHSLVHLFLLAVLLTLSPFRLMDFPATEGAGLNPLLQDPWMVIHPPVMFVAFAGAGIPFALVLAAIIKKDYSRWLKITFLPVAATSLALIIANVLGGYWAYETLGWGGYWAWDPVENTSFVPWVISIALIHGMIAERRTGALRRSNLLLSALVFFLIIFGTFLTRSGVLSDFSVHSFVDLGINGVLVGFLLAFLILTLAVFFLFRTPDQAGKPLNYNIFSRDFMLFIGLVLFLILGLVILFWSSLPLITQYFASRPAAADVATYNSFAFPFAIIISLFLTLSPFLVGAGFKLERLGLKTIISGLVAVIVAGALFAAQLVTLTLGITIFIYLGVMIVYFLSKAISRQLLQSLGAGLAGVIIALILGVHSIEYLFFIGASLTAAGAHVNLVAKYLAKSPRLVGGHLCHFGFGLMLVGILVSSAYSVNEQIVLPRNEQKSAFDYGITYKGLVGSITDNNNEIKLTLNHNGSETQARPQFFYARRMDGMMKKPYIKKNLFYDLYFAPQDIQELPTAQGLVLKKGDSAKVGDFEIKFVGFDMSSHDSSGMSVGATLEVTYKGAKETVTPKMVSSPDGNGMVHQSAKIFSGQNYDIALEHINAGEGTVTLAIPGLIESGPPDKLILDISRKPAINLLWLGTLIVFAGMAIVIYHRSRS